MSLLTTRSAGEAKRLTGVEAASHAIFGSPNDGWMVRPSDLQRSSPASWAIAVSAVARWSA
jgi:hypothetical protein